METVAWILPATSALAWAGAVQAMSLALVFASVRTNPIPGRTVVVAQLGLLALITAVVLLSHEETLSGSASLELLELGLWLLAGPLFLLYVRRALDLPAPSVAHFLPAPLFLLLAVSQELGSGVLPFMLHQLGYTLVGLWLYLRSPAEAGRASWWCRTWLIFLAAVHAAQFTRYFFAEVDAFRNVVPLTTAAGLFAISACGLRHSALLRAPARQRRAEHADLGSRILAALEGEQLYLDPDLTVRRLARALSIPRSAVSACLNRELGRSFHELLGHYRVEEAKRLLRDPDLGHLTVEAIGRRAGFRTRSTFYQRFRSQVGTTPSSWRLSE